MPPYFQLTEKEQGQADVHRQEGRSIRFTAKALGKSREAVKGYLDNPKDYGTRYKGRPGKLLSQRDRSHLIRRAAATGASSKHLLAELPVEISARTIRRELAEAEHLKYSKLLHTPVLQKHHKAARIDYAIRHLDTPPNWDKIIWSDEKKFNLDGPDGCKYVWHDVRIHQRTYSTRHTGGGSVMIWGGFCGQGKLELAFLHGRQNSEDYMETLLNHLLPFLNEHHLMDLTFMQDGASIHRSNATKAFLDNKNVRLFAHPALSPDFNPIENVWGLMVQQVYASGKQYESEGELRRAIERAWATIDQTYLDKLIASMPRRCRLVLEAKGSKTKY